MTAECVERQCYNCLKVLNEQRLKKKLDRLNEEPVTKQVFSLVQGWSRFECNSCGQVIMEISREKLRELEEKR